MLMQRSVGIRVGQAVWVGFLLLTMACGAAATPTPAPQATKAPAATIAPAATAAPTATKAPAASAPTATPLPAPTPNTPPAPDKPAAGAPVTVLPAPTTPEAQTGSTARSASQAGLSLVLSVPKRDYAAGEEIAATLTLLVDSGKPSAVTSDTSQLFDLIIRSETDKREEKWSAGAVFLQVLTTRQVPLIGGLSQKLTWKIASQAKGQLSLTGLTTPITYEGKRVQLQTPPVTVTVK